MNIFLYETGKRKSFFREPGSRNRQGRFKKKKPIHLPHGRILGNILKDQGGNPH
jgi:hypothetical protein